MPLPPFINLTKTKIQIWSEINVLRFAFIFISSTPLSISMLHVCHPPRPDKIFIRHVTFPFYCPLHSQSTQSRPSSGTCTAQCTASTETPAPPRTPSTTSSGRSPSTLGSTSPMTSLVPRTRPPNTWTRFSARI